MPLEQSLTRPITGIHPFNELPIDAEIWQEAHEHHHQHRRLHAMGAHRPGIVWGLEVVAVGKNTIGVAPGLGIDDNGQIVVVAEPIAFTLDEKGQTYITLSFLLAADCDSAVNVAGGEQHFRMVEGRDVKATQELPRGTYLELARLYRSRADHAVRDAKDAFNPGNDEINLLHRRLAFPHCFVDTSIGELSYVPTDDIEAWKPNRAGLCRLLREARREGFHLDFAGPVNLRTLATSRTQPALLYMAGKGGFQPLAKAELDGLSRFLSDGGLLWGESSGGDKTFAKAFAALVESLGAKLTPVKKGHEVLSSHHFFLAPPEGSQDQGELSADLSAGVLFSSYDYGAAWNGDVKHSDPVHGRERIRQAQEFGLNVIALAARLQRRRVLSRQLEGL